MSMGLLIAILTGIIIGRLNMERQVEDWVYEIRMGQTPAQLQQLSWMARVDYGLYQVKEIVGRIWVYVLIAIGIGAGAESRRPLGLAVVGGLLVVRKIRRFDLVLSFFFGALVTIVAFTLLGGGDLLRAFQNVGLYSPLFFFAFVILTEPLTMPPMNPTRNSIRTVVRLRSIN